MCIRDSLRELNRIEKEAGRERIIHWGPRTLDLDIIFYDDLISQEDVYKRQDRTRARKLR